MSRLVFRDGKYSDFKINYSNRKVLKYKYINPIFGT